MTESEAQETAEQLRFFADGGDFDAVEELWLEAMELDPLPVEAMRGVAQTAASAGREELAATRAVTLGEQLCEQELWSEALAVFKDAARFNPEERGLRDGLEASYAKAYADRSAIDGMLRASGIRIGSSVPEAVEKLELLLTFKPGDLLAHNTWGIGQVKSVRPRTCEIVVDFERRKGHAFGIEMARNLLGRVREDSFEARRFLDVDGLKQLAEEDPAALLKLVLRSNPDGLPSRAFRPLLCPGVIPEGGWTKWWSSARSALTKDPYVETGSGGNPLYRLRAEGISRSQELADALQAAADAPERVDLLRTLLREFKGDELDEGAASAFREALLADVERLREDNPALAFAVASALQSLAERWPDGGAAPQPPEPPEGEDDIFRWLSALAWPEYQKALLECVRRGGGDWQSVYVRSLELVSGEVRNWIWQGILDAPEQESAVNECRRLIERSDECVDAFFWLVREEVCGGRRLGVVPESAKALARMLTLAEQNRLSASVDKDEKSRSDWARIKRVLTERAFLKAALADCTMDDCRRLHRQLVASRYIDVSIVDALEREIANRHPEALHEEEQPADRYVFVTASGLEKRKKEYDHLVNVEVPKNARDLGEALSKGDLSENAEYDAARERQHRLAIMVRDMQEELSRARVIAPGAVSGDRVVQGARVKVLELDSGQERTLDILGPWDEAAPGVQMISYLAPVGAALIGAEVGREVEVEAPGGVVRFRVLGIEESPMLRSGD